MFKIYGGDESNPADLASNARQYRDDTDLTRVFTGLNGDPWVLGGQAPPTPTRPRGRTRRGRSRGKPASAGRTPGQFAEALVCPAGARAPAQLEGQAARLRGKRADRRR